MSGKQQDAKLDMALSEVIKTDKAGKKKKDAAASPKAKKAKKGKNFVKKTKQTPKGGNSQPAQPNPGKPKRNRTGSATKKPNADPPTATGRVRAAKAAQQNTQQSPKGGRKTHPSLQVTSSIRKKGKGQSPRNQRKAKRAAAAAAAAGGQGVTLSQRFSALKNSRA